METEWLLTDSWTGEWQHYWGLLSGHGHPSEPADTLPSSAGVPSGTRDLVSCWHTKCDRGGTAERPSGPLCLCLQKEAGA